MKEKSIFLKIMGSSPKNKVIDFLIIHRFDYSMADIAKHSGVGYATLKRMWPELEKNKIVKMKRKIGNAKLYQLNDSNPVVKEIKKSYWNITKEEIKREHSKEDNNSNYTSTASGAIPISTRHI